MIEKPLPSREKSEKSINPASALLEEREEFGGGR